MNKILLSVFIFLLISIAACQQAVKTETKAVTTTPTPTTGATGDAAVDAVSKDLNNVDGVEKDLSTDGLSGLDAGLDDVQKI